jgi:hypothetical protein
MSNLQTNEAEAEPVSNSLFGKWINVKDVEEIESGEDHHSHCEPVLSV